MKVYLISPPDLDFITKLHLISIHLDLNVGQELFEHARHPAR